MAQILSGISNADYHAHPAVSKSGLDKIAQSPAHYLAYLNGAERDTEAKIFGTAFHDFVLLPDTFAKQYTVLPDDFNARTKDGKALAAQIKAAGQTPLKTGQMADIKGMAAAIAAHPRAAALLQGGQAEQSIFWTDGDTGIDCRCRPDYLHPSGIIVDLKTTADAAPAEFARSVANYRYHVQDAFYSEGYYQATGKWPRGFVFIAVEKTAPYAVAVYSLDEEAKAYGRELWQRDLAALQNARQTEIWQAYNPEIQTLSLPAWAYR